jgi:hypothetical protein
MYEAEWRKLKHTKLLYEAGGFGKENAVALYAKILLLINAISPHWGLNPGPSVYKTDALPLSYRGICLCGGNKYHGHIIVDWWENSDGSICANGLSTCKELRYCKFRFCAVRLAWQRVGNSAAVGIPSDHFILHATIAFP